MSEYLGAASILIFFSAVLDFLDGRIARKLKVNSEFGVELDSLADIVSFGVAPALLFHTIATPSILTSLAFILFPTMGALRLAKFSIKPTIDILRDYLFQLQDYHWLVWHCFHIVMHGLL